MRMAILAPLYAPILENIDYGGAEWFIKAFAAKMKQGGHDVTVFASQDSYIKSVAVHNFYCDSKLVKRSVSLGKLFEDSGQKFDRHDEIFLETQRFLEIFKIQRNFDVIHNDIPNWYTIFCGSSLNIPFVTRLHTTVVQEQLKTLFENTIPKNVHLVGNSDSTTNIYKKAGLPVDATIKNGIEISKMPWSDKRGSYLVWVGRFMPYKGADLAIQVAKETGLPLKLAGRIQDKEYYKREIIPKLSKNIEYVGLLERAKVYSLLKNTICFLQTSLAIESFGNTTLESLATGTPVIGFALGATAEIIIPEKNGFLVKKADTKAMAKKVKEIDKISRQYCRDYVETNFSLDKMAEEYEKYFSKLISKF